MAYHKLISRKPPRVDWRRGSLARQAVELAAGGMTTPGIAKLLALTPGEVQYRIWIFNRKCDGRGRPSDRVDRNRIRRGETRYARILLQATKELRREAVTGAAKRNHLANGQG